MQPTGQHGIGKGGRLIAWNGRVVAAEDLPHLLNGQPELVIEKNVVVTPLAADELKRLGIRLVRRNTGMAPTTNSFWAVVQEMEDSCVFAAIKALASSGAGFRRVAAFQKTDTTRWAKAVAQEAAGGKCGGTIAFSIDAGLFCCIANKVAGIRAAQVCSPRQTARALKAVGPNLLAVEIGVLNFFETMQVLRTVLAAGQTFCPPELATTLRELESHAHR
jgi:ribose 5-phosphate isomerase RpiB